MTIGVSLDKSLPSSQGQSPKAPQGNLGGRAVINTTEAVNALRAELEREMTDLFWQDGGCILALMAGMVLAVGGGVFFAVAEVPLLAVACFVVGIAISVWGRCEIDRYKNKIFPQQRHLMKSLDATREFAEKHGIKLNRQNLALTHNLRFTTELAEQRLKKAQAAVQHAGEREVQELHRAQEYSSKIQQELLDLTR